MVKSNRVIEVIPYEAVHMKEEYVLQKVEVELGEDRTRSRKLPRWTGDRGIEGLFYCYDQFKQFATRLDFEDEDYWTYFPDILDSVAQLSWQAQTGNIAEADQTQERFEQEFNDFVTKHAGSTTPKRDMIKYLDSEECKKPPRNKSVREHVNRIEILCMYVNRLQGNDPDLDEQMVKIKIFETFPVPWQDEYGLHHKPEESTLAQLVEFFEKKKRIADATENDNKEKRKAKGKDKDAKGKKPKTGDGQQNMCRLHNESHPWKDCSMNPKSCNYYMKPTSPFYRGGQGGGRGQGGPGRGNGRGYGRPGGRGNYPRDGGYNNNNNNNNNDNYYVGDHGRDRGGDRYDQYQNNNNQDDRQGRDNQNQQDNYQNNHVHWA
eukprot:scaffold1294_cov78-Cylindrotheca_fusiformis.AAC.6